MGPREDCALNLRDPEEDLYFNTYLLLLFAIPREGRPTPRQRTVIALDVAELNEPASDFCLLQKLWAFWPMSVCSSKKENETEN